MGFRFKKFTYTGGSGTWGSSSTVRSRSESVLNDFKDFIVSSGTGWVLDGSLIDVPFWNPATLDNHDASHNAPAYIFNNTISGCKLFLCVQGSVVTSKEFAPKVPQTHFTRTPVNGTSGAKSVRSCSGVIMSIISNPDDSFGTVFDGSTPFLPESATLLQGTMHGNGSYSNKTTYIGTNTSGNIYAYGLYVDPYVVGINGAFTSNGTTPSLTTLSGYFCGRIIGTLAHDEVSPQARYGVLNCGYCSNGNNTEFSNSITNTVSVDTSAGVVTVCTYKLTDNLSTNEKSSGMQIFSAVGSPIHYVGNSCNLRYYPAAVQELSRLVSANDVTGLSRWTPYAVASCSDDHLEHGVVPGDGLKGYLDTNLFRAAIDREINILYDNGNFIGQNGILLGWDALNELP